MMLEKINAIIKRAWIVFIGFIMTGAFCSAMYQLYLYLAGHSQEGLLNQDVYDGQLFFGAVAWFIITPVVGYIIYRLTKFVFYGR